MKNNINKQAQNEVKDLLNEYVVSPLNTDITESLRKMSEELESLEESTKSDLSKIAPSIIGNVSTVKGELDGSFENLSDIIEDNHKETVDRIEEFQRLLDSTIHFDGDGQNAFENINASIETSKDGIVQKIDTLQNMLDKSVHFSDDKDSFERLNDLIKNSENNLSGRINLDKKELIGVITDVKSSVLELKTNLSDVDRQTADSTNEIKSELLITKDSINRLETLFTQFEEDVEEIHHTLINKNKRLLVSTFCFGVLNVIGFIIIIILCFLK
ncbi:MAG: hypothetical protein K5656_11145 [Lachnospiraceae bacterium]|nr:hypothetical protein [Lachnospiraceae bacterium]